MTVLVHHLTTSKSNTAKYWDARTHKIPYNTVLIFLFWPNWRLKAIWQHFKFWHKNFWVDEASFCTANTCLISSWKITPSPTPSGPFQAVKQLVYQKPPSFPKATILLVRPRIENTGHPLHPFKSDESYWLKTSERILCACSKIGKGQRSLFLVLTKRIAASEDKNDQKQNCWALALALHVDDQQCVPPENIHTQPLEGFSFHPVLPPVISNWASYFPL